MDEGLRLASVLNSDCLFELYFLETSDLGCFKNELQSI